MTFDQFEEFLLSAECHWEHDVSYIDKDGLQHYIDKCRTMGISKYYCKMAC